MEKEIYLILGILLSGIITIINSFFVQNKQDKREFKKDLLTEQKHAYYDVIYTLQDFMNNDENVDKFKELQKAYIKLSLYGDNIPASEMNKYYIAFTNSMKDSSCKPLTHEEHCSYHEKIVNGIRRSLKLNVLDSWYIVPLDIRDN
jgi:hypothetical protein